MGVPWLVWPWRSPTYVWVVQKKENRVLNAKLPIGRVIEKERVKVRKKEDALIRFNNS